MCNTYYYARYYGEEIINSLIGDRVVITFICSKKHS